MFKTISTILLGATLLVSTATQVDAQPAQRLLGEEVVTTTNVYSFANRAIDEATRIWASSITNGGWSTISSANGILNEGMPVSGYLASANVNITRASGVVHVDAQTLFDYLITPQGYQLIDPLSNPEDFQKNPLEVFATAGWRGAGSTGKRLEAARAETIIPGIRTREFVVLNVIDSNTRIFVSKSIQHKADAGCSVYGLGGCYDPAAVPVRAINTFGVQVTASPTNASQCVVQLINYADLMGPEIPAVAQNGINAGFLPAMLDRMRTAFV